MRGWIAFDGGPARNRARGRRLLLRQRDAAPPRLARARSSIAIAPGHARRFHRVHRRRRLPAARAVAVRRLGRGQRARLAGARTTGSARDGALACVHAARRGAGRSAHAGLPRELLRGRRLRALGERAPADRSRMGGGRARRAASSGNFVESGALHPLALREAPADGTLGAGLRRRLGVDAQRLRRPTRASAPPPARSASTTASSCATSTCCAAVPARRRPATSARATAISSRRTRAGSSPACASRAIGLGERADQSQAADQGGDRAAPGAKPGCRRPAATTRRAPSAVPPTSAENVENVVKRAEECRWCRRTRHFRARATRWRRKARPGYADRNATADVATRVPYGRSDWPD